MKLLTGNWLTVRLTLGGAIVALLVGEAMFAPDDLRTKVLLGSLLFTLVTLIAAALKGNRSTYQAAVFCMLATLTILLAGTFADTRNLLHLAAAGACGAGLVLASLPRAPTRAPTAAPAPPP
jgi:hypothetical protein